VAGARRRAGLVAVRKASGHTQESLAAALNIDRSTVIRWEAGDHAPLPYLRPRLARLLGQSLEQLRVLIDDDSDDRPEADGVSVDFETAFDWLDRHAGWSPGVSRRKVLSRLEALNEHELHDRNSRRAKVGRSEIAQTLLDFYRDKFASGFNAYRVHCDGRDVVTSVITRSEWVDVNCPLTLTHDHLLLANSTPSDFVQVNNLAANHAVRRLAEAVAANVRLTDAPIYRLLGIDVRQGAIGGALELASFVEYALTLDLLEGELLDAIV
jgi:transcriptional regulator with XRE-family HTH domain